MQLIYIACYKSDKIMDLIRATMYKFFDLPFHKRVEIAKKLEIYNDADLELKPLEATQKWGKKIVDEKLIDQLNNFIYL